MNRLVAVLIAASLAGLPATGIPSAASAKDLGVRGATWPVVEPDLLAEIESRLLEMQRSGALARFEDEARERARRRIEEPVPVPGIAPARTQRVRLFDPAITVARDIRTTEGVLIAAAGTRVNPLERIALARDLLFVDGRREAEIAWALAREGGKRAPRQDRAVGGPAPRPDAAPPAALLLRHRRTVGRALRHRGDAEPGRAGGHAAPRHRDPGRGPGRSRIGVREELRTGGLKPC